jgi:hypothetical protein
LFNTHNQMKHLLLSILASVSIVSGNNEPGKALDEREKRLFSLFSIVTFPNKQCTATSSTTSSVMYGTCYTASECSAKGGTVDGNCAAGFGVCCTFTVSASGTSVDQNCTYLQNPSYPTTYTTAGTVTYSVSPCQDDICQMRLDFDNFDITETTAGVCTDSLTVTGPTGRNPMDLCGTLTGMHLYVEQGRSSTATTIAFTIVTGGTWKIKVSQIECSSLARAYPDCNQYITGVSGNVNSYNWPTVMLQSKSHNICIRKEAGYCGLSLNSYTDTSPDSFIIDDTATTTSINGGLTVQNTGNLQGWVDIPGTKLVSQFSGGIFCENSAATCGTSGSVSVANHNYVITHVTQGQDNDEELGFKLTYLQLPCSASNPHN